MDFLSLFEPAPAEGGPGRPRTRHKHQETVENAEGTINAKGRRRGRRANGKNETLPEESSFLNEPDLSTEILVKDGSYIDSYIEITAPCDETKSEDKKVKKRATGRKSRRRKKISPAKELCFDKIYTSNNNLNNTTVKPKMCDENIGKNVNDLKSDDFKARYRISDFNNDENDFKNEAVDFKNDGPECNEGGEFKDRAVYNVIDKLEKVSLKDDMFLAGDFTVEDLESDFIYSSDDDGDYLDEDTSEGSDSCGEAAAGSLPPEPRFGNVEYKLRLSARCERRFQHLVTQLKWRLVSGGGSCVYVVGVRDCGALCGLRARALRSSLHALRRMARAVHARLARVHVRRVRVHRAVAEVTVRRVAHAQQSVELRVAVMGANEAGKSTLIGVLTQGELDNGAGSARLNMFRHQHEVKSGMTSSLSHEILGFDAQGNVVNYGCSELMTAERIGERSAKLVSFLDLAGHSKYQRTTRHGLTGYSPHYAMLVISATAGITAITEEHMAILLALRLPFFIVLNKCELAHNNVAPLVARLRQMLANYDKKPVLIRHEAGARDGCAPHTHILDSVEPDLEPADSPEEVVPVFPVSCVRGFGLSGLHAHLLALQPPPAASPEEDTCEFQIDEIFHVGDSGDPVVGGLMARGQIFERDKLLIGPLEDGSFRQVCVRSIYRNRVPSGSARAGQPASLGLRAPCPPVRPGMVLLGVPAARGGRRAAWGACSGSQPCRSRLQRAGASERAQSNKNLLADAHTALAKHIDNTRNLFPQGPQEELSDGEGVGVGVGGEECVCADRVLLEDPADPRGCLFFQARVSVLRHATRIAPGYQCTVHVGNVRQTAIIEGIMSRDNALVAGETASALFRFVRTCEYLVRGRQLLFTAGLGTRGVGRITQIFPYVP